MVWWLWAWPALTTLARSTCPTGTARRSVAYTRWSAGTSPTPGYVTGWVRVYLPSLGFYYRPDVWRGNDGKQRVREPRLHVVVLSLAERTSITWTCDEDEPRLGLRRVVHGGAWPADQGLPHALGLFRSARRPVHLRNAHLHQAPALVVPRPDAVRTTITHVWEKGALSLMDGRWPWLAVGGIHDRRTCSESSWPRDKCSHGPLRNCAATCSAQLGLLFVSHHRCGRATFPAVDSWHDQWRDYAHQTQLGQATAPTPANAQ